MIPKMRTTTEFETLADWGDPWVQLGCWRCDRQGRYRLDGLIARHGAAIHMGILLRRLVGQCRHGANCGAHYSTAPVSAMDQGRIWRPMTVGQLTALLARHPPETPVLVASEGLGRARRVRVIAIDDGEPPKASRDGQVGVLITSIG